MPLLKKFEKQFQTLKYVFSISSQLLSDVLITYIRFNTAIFKQIKQINIVCKFKKVDTKFTKVLPMYKLYHSGICTQKFVRRVYIGRTSKRFHIKKDQHVTYALRNLMTYGTNKPINQSALGEHSLIAQNAQKAVTMICFKLLVKDVVCIIQVF